MSIMEINKSDLLSAAAQAGITNSQAEALWKTLASEDHEDTPTNKFDLPHIMYYLGAMIVISAMGWFLSRSWELFGGGGICLIALAYAAVFLLIGHNLWKKTGLRVPGGLFITLAVTMLPLAIYGFQRYTGWWGTVMPGEYRDFFAWVRGGWFTMELGTIIGGCLALKFYRFPFLTAPIFFSLWFMSMDITPLIFGNAMEHWEWVSLWFGLGVLIVAYLIDQRTTEDFAFWGYFFGMLAFWAGLEFSVGSSELQKFIRCLINVVLILLSVLLQRRVFLVFGVIGVFSYIWDLFFTFFQDSALFPFVLSLIGVLIVFAGVIYRKHHTKIEQRIFDSLPERIQSWLPKSRSIR